MNRVLLLIKSAFRKIGIDIRFVKTMDQRSAFELNEVNQVNDAWSDPKIAKGFLTKEVLDFYERIIEKINEYDLDLANKSVADIGCGNGMLLKYINEKFNISHITGLEYSEAALDVARKIFKEPDYILHDISNPINMKFDMIFCTEVLEHIPYPNQALANILNALNDKSAAFITVPDGRQDTYSGHINFWSPESWHIFIEENAQKLKFQTGKLTDTVSFAIIFKR